MGADNKYIFKKCGEILIDPKSKKWKVKLYQFNCAYCNIHYGQLKKFSKHIENKHFKEFTEESEDMPETYVLETKQEFTEESEDKPVIYVPEVKLEELVEDKITDVLSSRKNDDPLETLVTVMLPTVASTDELMEEDVKNEIEDNYSEDGQDYSMNNCEMYNEDDDENIDSEAEEEVMETSKKLCPRLAKGKRKKKINSDDVSSDDSQDADFNFEEEVKGIHRDRFFRFKPKKKEPQKQGEECVISEDEIVIDEKELSIALLEAFEKKPFLWDVEKRIFNKALIQKDYEILTNEVNEKLKYRIKWQEARKRIRQMRFQYSVELEKQRKGQEYEMPWYVEHMKYLQENIDVLLKGRYEVSKYRALKTMDETELTSLIELYKKNEILWQVNNLAFGISQKKDAIFEEIREQLNQIHNLTITAEHFHRRINYMHRLYSKDKERELKCELEKREFIPSSPFYKQMSFLKESQGPFKCSNCNEIIERYDNYHIHVAKHSNVVPFTCPQCQMGFKIFSRYLQHKKRHLQINNYHCNICGKGYPFKSELDVHELSHTGDKPFLCQICGESFRGRIQHDIHVRKHENRFRHTCEICKQGFYRTNLYQAHVKMHLNIRDFVCSICGKAYITKKNLVRHQLIHEDKRSYSCNVCDKKFAQKSTLQTHQKVHEMYSV